MCRCMHSNISQPNGKAVGERGNMRAKKKENQRIEMTEVKLCTVSKFDVFCHRHCMSFERAHRKHLNENRQLCYGNIHNISFKRDM